jgi:hypothetical protein
MNPKDAVLQVHPTAHMRQWGRHYQVARKRTDEDRYSQQDYVFIGPSRRSADKAWQAAAETLNQNDQRVRGH